MMTMQLRDVVTWTGAMPEAVDLSRPIAGITIDSRTVEPDSLFVALPGSRQHGNDFLDEVWRRGGVALVENSYGGHGGPLLRTASPLGALGQMMRSAIEARGVQVVGVTGSVGKTSVKELTYQVLASQYVTGYSHGNYNTAIGLPLSFFAEPPDMTWFVAEMAMRQLGEIYRLTQMAPPRVAAITNIGQSHLEQLGSIERIQSAKGEILEGMPAGGTAVLNADDPLVRELGERTPHPVRWYGKASNADLRILDATLDAGTTRITLSVGNQTTVLTLPWIGLHQAYNAAAALLIGLEAGVALDQGIAAISQIDPLRSRIVPHRLGTLTLIEDAYNASPSSMRAALDVLQSFTGRKIAVLGDMLELGPAETTGHQEIGEYAGTVADWVLGVGPRSRILVDAAGAHATHRNTIDEAFEWLRRNLAADDVVLLKASRGMRFEDLIGKITGWGGPQ